MRRRKGKEGLSEDLRGEAKAVKAARDTLQKRWFCYFFSVKVSAVIWSSFGFFYAEGL